MGYMGCIIYNIYIYTPYHTPLGGGGENTLLKKRKHKFGRIFSEHAAKTAFS